MLMITLLPTIRRSVSGNCLKSFLKSSLRCLYVGLRTYNTNKTTDEEHTHTLSRSALSHSWSSVKRWFSFAMQQREMNPNEFIPSVSRVATASHSQTSLLLMSQSTAGVINSRAKVYKCSQTRQPL